MRGLRSAILRTWCAGRGRLAIERRAPSLLCAIGLRRQTNVEGAGLERIFVLPQRRIVGRHRYGKPVRQAPVEQARTLELVEPGQVADRIQPEMREERFRRAIGHRTPRRLASAARLDPAGL